MSLSRTVIWANLTEIDTTIKQNEFHARWYLFPLCEQCFIIWNAYSRCSLNSLPSLYGFGLENTDCPLSTTSNSWWPFVFMRKEHSKTDLSYTVVPEELQITIGATQCPTPWTLKSQLCWLGIKLIYNSTHWEKRLKKKLWISILNVWTNTLKWTVNFIFLSLFHCVATSGWVEYGQLLFILTSGHVILFGCMVSPGRQTHNLS